MHRQPTWQSWLIQVAAFSLTSITLAILLTRQRYGSFQGAAAAITQQPLLVDPSLVDLGVLSLNDSPSIELNIQNTTDRSVSILGLDDCCFSSLKSQLPITIDQNESTTLLLTFIPHGKLGETVTRTIPIVTDSFHRPSVIVRCRINSISAAAP